MYISNKRGHRMEPWGAPKGISAQEEQWPLKIILCIRLLKKSLKMLIIAP